MEIYPENEKLTSSLYIVLVTKFSTQLLYLYFSIVLPHTSTFLRETYFLLNYIYLTALVTN